MQTCETTNRNHIEGLEGRGKLAQDSKAHRFGAQGKWGVCARRVRVLTWGDLRRERCTWMTNNPGWFAPGYQEPGAVASCPLRVEERGSNVMQVHSAAASDGCRDDAEVSSGHSRSLGSGH